MNRLSDNDKNWGPFTLGTWFSSFSISLESAEYDDQPACFYITGFKRALRIALPFKIGPNKKFSISLSGDCGVYDLLQVHYGRTSWDSSQEQRWSMFLPWLQWRHVRHSYYTPEGDHFFTEEPKDWERSWAKKKECPKSTFLFKDYDGKEIVATATIEEREWHRGEGCFKWLRFFYQAKISRSLDLSFSEEVGPGKGSWKGGTVGHSIEMLPGEYPLNSFKRYCNNGYRGRGGPSKLEFIKQLS